MLELSRTASFDIEDTYISETLSDSAKARQLVAVELGSSCACLGYPRPLIQGVGEGVQRKRLCVQG